MQPGLSTEERKVRAARRFTVIALLLTVLWMLMAPAFGLLLVPPLPGFAPILLVGLFAALALHVWRLRMHVRTIGAPAGWPFVLAALVVGIGLAAAGFASNPIGPGFFWTIITGVLVGDVVIGWRWWAVLAMVLACALVVFAAGVWLIAQAPRPEGYPVWLLPLIAAFYVGSFWAVDFERVWWLRAVLTLDDSRRTAADLATARERLRLADDLHDILGHALEVVAFKAELAGRLTGADPARAQAELEEVQRVARDSLREVRALALERRPTDLVNELAGARAVLESAGIELTVDGDPTLLDTGPRDVLGRVLREAMTNVLRHAEASRCSITIGLDGGQASLRVVNDGVLAAKGQQPGSGLAALTRQLEEHAGRLDTVRRDGTFEVRAVLPGTAR